MFCTTCQIHRDGFDENWLDAVTEGEADVPHAAQQGSLLSGEIVRRALTDYIAIQ